MCLYKGEKHVECNDSGHSKDRYTVVITIAMDGRILPTLIIFGGLKYVPKDLILPKDILVCVASRGFMNA